MNAPHLLQPSSKPVADEPSTQDLDSTSSLSDNVGVPAVVNGSRRRDRRISWLTLLPVVVFGVIASVVAYRVAVGQQPSVAVDAASTNRIRVAVQPVDTIKPPTRIFRFRGVVLPRRESELAFRRSGRVESISVDVGDEVDEGQVIGRLENSDLDAAEKSARSELAVAEAAYAEAVAGPRPELIDAAVARVKQLEAQFQASSSRLKRDLALVKAQAASQEEVDDERLRGDQLRASIDEAQATLRELRNGTRQEQIDAAKGRVESARATLAVLDVQRRDSEIRAPFSGVIAQRFVDEGSMMSSGAPVIELVENPPLEASFGLPPEFAQCFCVGDVAEILCGTRLGESDAIEAVVVRLSPRVDRATRTRDVVVQFDSDQVELIGLPAAILIESGKAGLATSTSDQGIWIPSTALVRNVRGLWSVYVARPDVSEVSQSGEGLEAVVEVRDVKVIETSGQFTLVESTLSREDRLIIAGTHRVGPGVKIIATDQNDGNG